jgi:hypothetical protein
MYENRPTEITRPEFDTLVDSIDRLLALFGVEPFPAEFKEKMDFNRITQHLSHAEEEVAAMLGGDASSGGGKGAAMSAMMANSRSDGRLSDLELARRISRESGGRKSVGEVLRLIPR